MSPRGRPRISPETWARELAERKARKAPAPRKLDVEGLLMLGVLAGDQVQAPRAASALRRFRAGKSLAEVFG